MEYPKPGLGNVGSYQTSGIPWVSSSLAPSSGDIIEFNFPKVTRFIQIKNRSSSSTLRFGFDQDRMRYSTGDYGLLLAGESITLEIRAINLFIMSHNSIDVPVNVSAGLTSIQGNEYPENLLISPISLLTEQNINITTENEDYLVLE